MNDASDDRLARTYSVNTIIRHDKYLGRGIFYDVALIHTVEQIEFNRNTVAGFSLYPTSRYQAAD